MIYNNKMTISKRYKSITKALRVTVAKRYKLTL